MFADGEVDRSPCGSGTSARLALLDAARELARGDELRHLSIVGSEFRGRVVDVADVAGRPAVVTDVEGSAYRTGRATWELDPDDPLGEGFLLGRGGASSATRDPSIRGAGGSTTGCRRKCSSIASRMIVVPSHVTSSSHSAGT